MDLVSIGLLLALSGAVLGGISGITTWADDNDAKQDAVDDQLAIMDAEFTQAKDEATKSADQSDAQVTLSEAVLGDNVNSEIQTLAQSEKTNALSYNAANMSIGSTEGSSYAASAASGTRGSSAIQAAATQAENSSTSLQAQEDSDRLSDSLTLQSVMNSAQEQVLSNNQTRQNNADIRASYATGGSEYNLYQKKRSAYESANSPDTSLESGLSAMISGMSSGASLFSSVGKWVTSWL